MSGDGRSFAPAASSPRGIGKVCAFGAGIKGERTHKLGPIGDAIYELAQPFGGMVCVFFYVQRKG